MSKIQENRFLVIDDARSIDHYKEKYFRPFNIDAEIALVRDLPEAIRYLDGCKESGSFPETVILDMCTYDYKNPDREGVDEEWGKENASGLVSWYNSNNSAYVYPKNILLNSVDYDVSVMACEIIKNTFGKNSNVVMVCAGEAELAGHLLAGTPASKSQVETRTNGFRSFLNERYGHSFPCDKAGVVEYQNKNKVWDIYHVPDLVKEKSLSVHEALDYIREPVREMASSGFKQSVDINPYLINEFGFRFRGHIGDYTKAYAAFSYDEVQALAEDGKKSVLITDDHHFSFKNFRKDLAGVIFVTDNVKSHDCIILEAWGMNTLSGLPDIRYNFKSHTAVEGNPDFIKDTAGNPITSFLKIADNNGRKELRSYETALNKIARDHIKDCCDRGLGTVTDINVDINTLRFQRIIPGDFVTINPTGHAFKGHFDVSRSNTLTYNDRKLISDVIDMAYHDTEVRGQKLIEFKANIDTVTLSIGKNTNVGLVRTEHFIRENSDLKKSFRKYVLDGKRDDLQYFTDLHKKVMNEFTANVSKEMAHKDAKVRVRLADAPPAEFFKEKDFDVLENKFGDRNIRGVQLATALPALYDAQLKGIFESFKPLKGKVRPEILVPTVRTEEELVFVKEMTARIASGYGFSREEYGFGTMIETKDAVKNIESLVQHSDFVNIGTNDLTSEILDCARDDWNKIACFMCEPGFKANPFIELHPEINNVLIDITDRVHTVKPDAEICVCGEQARNLNSLLFMNAVGITGVSLPPSEQNMQGLKVRYYLNV